MGSGRSMCWIQLLLEALVAFSSLVSLTAGTPLQVISAPNLLRIGTEEKFFVEIQDATLESTCTVQIIVKNHPTKVKILAQTYVNLNQANNFQAFGTIKIPSGDFSKEPNLKQYVVLEAHFPGRVLEKVVLVSFQSGFIFIQTDKTIYTPSSNVRYRIFALNPGMKPLEQSASVIIDIVVMYLISHEQRTPGDIVVKSDTFSLAAGMFTGTYDLDKIVSFLHVSSIGLWKVVAKFNSNPQHSFEAAFEVKEYVLPSFEVKLSAPPESPFFYVDSNEMNITIDATYVFGEKVDGTGYAIFGVIIDGERKGLPSSLQRVKIQRGIGVITLKKADITAHFPNIHDLVGMTIYAAVSVLTESGSEMVEAELRNIKIVTSPYTIRFTKTTKYFKPGLAVDVVVEVLNPDNTPANKVPVLVEPGAMQASTTENGIARLTINTMAHLTILSITARTNHHLLSLNRQATASMVAHQYNSKSKSYLHLKVDTTEVKVGTDMKITIYLGWTEKIRNDITYLILSKGQLVKHKRIKNDLQSELAEMVAITKEMLPSFRIVAYYHIGSDEVVSDSVWVDVKDTCMGTLKLELTRPSPSYEPRKSFGLKVTGDPGATVGLVAVDRSVYVLNNKHRLTQKKIWDTVEQYDTGCTAGGGKDGMSVFYDAGLVFETNLLSGTPYRTELKCPSSSRKKRDRTIMEVRASLVFEYQDKVLKECCVDGMRDIPVSYTCEKRSEYILDGAACVEAFLRCCKEVERLELQRKKDILVLARSEDDGSYIDRNEFNSRTNFPESWLWSDIVIAAGPIGDPNCDPGCWQKNIPLPDTITTWELTGISMSATYGICVAEPLEVIVWKPFFIDLRLPYSAVRDEQLEIKAVLHNYNLEAVTVRVEMKENLGVCSAAYKKGWFTREVTVGPQTTQAVPFIVIPMKDGDVPIEIKAAVKHSYQYDGIQKMLRVVVYHLTTIKLSIFNLLLLSFEFACLGPQGVLVKTKRSVILNPAIKGGTQMEKINSKIPETDLVPNTPTNTIISVTGREQLSSLLDNAISGDSMGTLIQEPFGCGEQNMAGMTLPVIAHIYLDKTNQWENVGFEKRSIAIQHITTGYVKQLKYRKNDGSFAIFPGSQSTTWLTAYVTKVFSMVYNQILVQQNVICDAVKFLILNTQQPDGTFMEIGSVYDKSMIGDVGGVDSDASMTAFCLIAMQQSRTICSTTVNSMPNSMQKAVTYLEQRLPSLTNPYAVALTSCALAEEGKLNMGILYKFASSDGSHWPVPKGHIYSLEATAYALLALVKAKAFQEGKPIVRWLSQNKQWDGGYGSTQATIMVYQAVAEYWTSVKETPYDLNVDVLIAGKSLIDKYNLNHANHYTTRSSKFDGINKDVTVIAKGTGEATFNMVSLYYTLPKIQESDCEMFDLTVQLLPEKLEEDKKTYKLRIDVLFKNKERSASMSILDIGLPTGCMFDKNDLEALSSGHAALISKYEMDKALSKKGSLIIYLRKVSNEYPEEISFRIHQQMKVGVLQPAAVSVYEYYDRKHCVKFYRPERQSGELLRLCRGNECICAEENCSMQKKGDISTDERTIKACESTSTSKIDFVYKVIVEDFTDRLTTDMYRMRILESIKEGSSDVGPQNQTRTFLSYQHCREALNMTTSKTYLIMGPFSDIYKDGTSFQYILGENSWIEYWPTSSECQNDEYRATCMGMEELVDQLKNFGCQM
ncbi:complement C3-like [Xenentodon cancila]